MGKFCFLCGKKTEKLKDGYCKECYSKKVSLIEVPKSIKLTKCKKCNLFLINNKWQEGNIEDAILDKIKLIGKNIELEVRGAGSKYEVIASNGKEEVHKVDVIIKEIVCPICARAFSDYYEAIIQIRGNYTDRILDYIDEQLYMLSKKNRKAFYKIKKVKGGIDIRLGSKAAAYELGEIMRRKFRCEVVRSYILVGKREGHDLYRNVIALRF